MMVNTTCYYQNSYFFSNRKNTMKFYAVVSGKECELILRDNYLNEKKELVSGVLLFTKKAEAEAEAAAMNRLRKGMRLPECYSVAKIEEEECGFYGRIIDGKPSSL